ncbi:MAG: right-handed parallel beta-helix repeat-containing protein [Candidatus Lokiarchaeota archaeon]|nr:right-handed parallel beta-helix repeat-containing protein [Candidatus Lokiarchaeota archaeon]
MKSNRKSKIIILIILGILFALFPIVSTKLSFTTENSNKSPEFSDDTNSDDKNLKISIVSGKIHIDNNWTAAKAAGICIGNGTYSNPYTIEDKVINGGGVGDWTAILIENSYEYFSIENCSFYHSEWPPYYGITLNNVQNGLLLNNNCSSNRYGIRLSNSNNNTISENIVNNAGLKGISLYSSNYNLILGNIINNSGQYGIYLEDCKYNTVLENEMNRCGLEIQASLRNGNWTLLLSHLNIHNIDTTNLVNGKPLYYYTNEVSLGSDNFTNAGQVILVNCTQSLVSGLYISYGSKGISLYFCNYNNISYNSANYNSNSGIYLKKSDTNLIVGNDADYNHNYGIDLIYSSNNSILRNTAIKVVKRGSGIHMEGGNNNIISENIANNNNDGIKIRHSTNNQILGNIVFYNHHGISLFKSVNNVITGNIANNNSNGIELLVNSNNNHVTGNTANNNGHCGIYLYLESNNNIITGNTLVGNEICIQEYRCDGNRFWDNGGCTYGLEIFFELIIWISIIGGVAIVMVTLYLIRRKRKRIL